MTSLILAPESSLLSATKQYCISENNKMKKYANSSPSVPNKQTHQLNVTAILEFSLSGNLERR